MVVAPWILPLRVAVFAVLIGDWRLLPRSALTLVAGALVTTLLSMMLGLMAQANGLLTVDAFSGEGDPESVKPNAPGPGNRLGRRCCCHLRQGQPWGREFHGWYSDCRRPGSTGLRLSLLHI